ncbi:hypothetical protein F2Q70_00035880 [Brassica cretica]|uniref:Uncharacterized protein n=1 Tax=Brassica cretica TaxID=69181 RepID=A0A8S9JZ57_BRACR|nr:hypothetical protein F2Q70_00035880 [Brassica cretica]
MPSKSVPNLTILKIPYLHGLIPRSRHNGRNKLVRTKPNTTSNPYVPHLGRRSCTYTLQACSTA